MLIPPIQPTLPKDVPTEAHVSACEQYGVPHEEIARAAALLRAGRLVAFPTETVYGLGRMPWTPRP